MAKKNQLPKPELAPAKRTFATARFPDPEDKDKAEAYARMALRPSYHSAVIVEKYSKNLLGDQDLGTLVDVLAAGMEDLRNGDSKRIEAMLYGQAHSLQAIFTNLARLAFVQDHLDDYETIMRLAMKAQNQCRATLETLSTIKNPPVLIARQANINNGGQQQVNNGRPPDPACQEISHFSETELLEDDHGQRLDTRTSRESSGPDPRVETVGAVHRPTQR